MAKRLLCSVAFTIAVALAACDGRSDSPPAMKVRSVSGTYDLAGTSWVKCFPGEPEPGKSRRTIDTFASGRGTHVEDVFGTADCSGTPDDSAHDSTTATFDVGPDRAVGWNGEPPAGLAAEVTASGVTWSAETITFQTLAYVDETAEPDRLYTGNEDGPLDQDGYPQQLEEAPATRE